MFMAIVPGGVERAIEWGIGELIGVGMVCMEVISHKVTIQHTAVNH
jgi:hypothetical protein